MNFDRPDDNINRTLQEILNAPCYHGLDKTELNNIFGDVFQYLRRGHQNMDYRDLPHSIRYRVHHEHFDRLKRHNQDNPPDPRNYHDPDILDAPVIKQLPNNRTERVVQKPPENFLLQFIGGPKNSKQVYYNYREYFNIIHQGAFFNIAVPLPPSLNPDNSIRASRIEEYRYKLTFIPTSETPFSEDQIVIGIFQ